MNIHIYLWKLIRRYDYLSLHQSKQKRLAAIWKDLQKLLNQRVAMLIVFVHFSNYSTRGIANIYIYIVRHRNGTLGDRETYSQCHRAIGCFRFTHDELSTKLLEGIAKYSRGSRPVTCNISLWPEIYWDKQFLLNQKNNKYINIFYAGHSSNEKTFFCK